MKSAPAVQLDVPRFLIMDATKIKISSFNANGLGNKNKRLAVAKWLKENSSGIVFLQETHCP